MAGTVACAGALSSAPAVPHAPAQETSAPPYSNPDLSPEQDLSHESPDTPLPDAVASAAEPLIILGTIAGGTVLRCQDPRGDSPCND